MNDTFRKERLAHLIKTDYGGKQENFVQKSGRSKGRVSQMLSESEPFGEAAARQLASDLGLKPQWFDIEWPTPQEIEAAPRHKNWLSHRGKGIKHNFEDEHDPSSITHETPLENFPRNSLTIRQFDVGGGMGRGIVLQDQPGVIQSMEVTQEWVQKNIRNFSSVSNLAIVTGFGDSMRPLYNSGDPLLVDRAVTEVRFEAIYFFRVGDEGFVKRLQRIPGKGILVISDNEKYRDWTITEDMDFEVFARVIKVWCGEDF